MRTVGLRLGPVVIMVIVYDFQSLVGGVEDVAVGGWECNPAS